MPTEMIEKRLKIISDLRDELKKLKEHYDEALESDAQFQEIHQTLEKVRNEVKDKQNKILTNSVYKAVYDELKNKRIELKENREALAQELVEYYRESGSMEITGSDGNIKKVKFSVRLVS